MGWLQRLAEGSEQQNELNYLFHVRGRAVKFTLLLPGDPRLDHQWRELDGKSRPRSTGVPFNVEWGE